MSILIFGADPTAAASGAFTVVIGDDQEEIGWTVTAYETRTPARTAPDLGLNGKLNTTLDTSDALQIELDYEEPTLILLGSSFKRYEWVVNPSDLDTATWTTSNSGNFSITPSKYEGSTGDHTLYVRTVEEVGTVTVPSEALGIPIFVWERPVVADDPPNSAIPTDAADLAADSTKVNWFSTQYVGIINDTVRLQADGDSNSSNGDTTETIAKYVWDLGEAGTFEQHEVLEFDNSTDIVMTGNAGILGG